MDLGIAGRKAIVCASSRGLGFACAKALAQAGCEVVINGRDEARLTAAAAELKKAGNGARITPVAADVATSAGQQALGSLSAAGHPGQQQWRTAISRFPRARSPEDA
jgi:3-oxoacyl-[acyl-carrier protein] reductase